MNRKSVIIKSNKYGLTVILDDKMPFQELLLDIADKFQESANFFRNAAQRIDTSCQKCKNGCDIPWKSTEPGRRTAGDRDNRRSLRHPYPLCGG